MLNRQGVISRGIDEQAHLKLGQKARVSKRHISSANALRTAMMHPEPAGPTTRPMDAGRSHPVLLVLPQLVDPAIGEQAGSRELVPATAAGRSEASRSEAPATHLTRNHPPTPAQPEQVPTTLGEAVWVFFTSPSVLLAVSIISACAVFRLSTAPLTLLDLTGCVLAAGLWIVQEWVIHKYLLHASFSWLGKTIHEQHHAQPYHHVSIDGPEIVGPFMVLAASVLWLVLHQGGAGLVASACVGYFTAGLLSYQFTHYLVHTRWIPTSPYFRAVRRNHMLHHLRNYDNWFAFSAPQMDKWMGTCPDRPGDVPLRVVSPGGVFPTI